MTARETVRARRARRRRRRLLAAAAVAVVVGAGAGTAWATSGSGTPRYRLATVVTGTVSQVVDADGALAARRVAVASFPVPGTVATVPVTVGQHVIAGQTLATLDPASLAEAVSSARLAVASAQATLTDDEDGIPVPSATGAGQVTTRAAVTGPAPRIELVAARTAAAPGGPSPSPAPSGTQGGTPAAGASSVAAASAQVTAAAKALAAALDGRIDTVASACAATTTTTTSTVTAAADDAGTISGSTGAATTQVAAGGVTVTPSPDGTWTLSGLTAGHVYPVTITQQRSSVDAEACTTAVGSAGAASADVAHALTAFDDAVAALQRAAAAAGRSAGAPAGGGSTSSGAPGTSGPTGRSGTSGRSGSTGSSGSAGSRVGGTSGSVSSSATGSTSGRTGPGGAGATAAAVPVTSEKIAADVAAVAAANAGLAVAQNQLAGAALTAPVSGTVAAVGLTPGARAAAGSSTAAVTVVADGPMSVSLSVPLSRIDLVRVGQTAQVTVDGRSAPVAARVSYVGLLDTASGTSTSAAYTVTVELDAVTAGLVDGMGAQVSIAVGTARDTAVVPLSALHTTGTRHTVDVYTAGRAVPTTVQVGLVGADTAQVTQGLRTGQRVVLADTTEATPTSTTTGVGRGLGGGFGGGFGGRGGGLGGGLGGGARPGGTSGGR